MPPRLLTEQEFGASRYADVAEQIDGGIVPVIVQAEAYIEHAVGRTLSSATYTEHFRPQGTTLRPRQYPVRSITTIKRRSTHTVAWEDLDPANYEISSIGTIILSLDDELAGYEIELVYVAGYDPVPDDIKVAVINQTVLYAFQDLEVFGAGDSKEPALKHLRSQVDDVIKLYRRARIG